ncbi:PLDc N-terminal domain-containing protein, partial [Bradyrhizobium sp. SZCCHNR1083]
MPVALVIILLQISLIYHASRTGRMQPWAFIILLVPLIGALAYIVVELVPEWLGSHDVQKAR